MFDKIQTSLKTQGSAERNLIFIDPTGYKEIHRDDLFKLLQSKKSEVVLFLPISFMYRFKEVVQKDFDNPAYVHLRRFINEFFDESHPIRQNEFMSVFTFMKHLAEAFKFNDQFFCTSFSLQRNKNTYYALFFISPHILGLERIIDAKWEIDKQQGKGFIYEEKVGASQLSLFPENTPSAMEERLVELEKLMRSFIEKNPECSNCDLYKFILQNDFRPSHGTQILKKWQAGNLIQVWEKEKNKTAKKNAFYLNYDCYKSTKEVVTYKFL